MYWQLANHACPICSLLRFVLECLLFAPILYAVAAQNACSVPPCQGPLRYIFCEGEMLETAWKFGHQEYMNQKLKFDADETLQRFKRVSVHNASQVAQFFSECFQTVSTFTSYHPPDWQEAPASFDSIVDPIYRRFAVDLNRIWLNLSRRMSDDIRHSADRYSYIHVPHNLIIPGGRFQNFFYWDSFWIAKGLLFSGMHATVRGMLLNFDSLVDQLGHIPNACRKTFAERSQPPFFAQMTFDYWQRTGDNATVAQLLTSLDREMQFWLDRRSLQLGTHLLFQYRSQMDCPRPEEYLLDVADANQSTFDHKLVYRSIASACESGWDFSGRWFEWEGQGAFRKSQIRTIQIVPVDLNALMCRNFEIMAAFHEQIKGDQSKAAEYRRRREQLVQAIDQVFWNDSAGAWFDFDLQRNRHRVNVYLSAVYPLYADCLLKSSRLERLVAFLEQSGIGNFPGGLPVSLNSTGQQWDFPNGWPPLNHLVIDAFERSGHARLRGYALQLAQMWVRSNYLGFSQTGSAHLWEKYDVRSSQGAPGSGGEYNVTVGFGWSNGVILDLLWRYADRLHFDHSAEPSAALFGRSTTKGAAELFAGWLAPVLAVCAAIVLMSTMTVCYARRSAARAVGGGYSAVPLESEALLGSSSSDS